MKWLQMFLDEAESANKTGCVISNTVWKRDAATIKRIIDIAPNLKKNKTLIIFNAKFQVRWQIYQIVVIN